MKAIKIALNTASVVLVGILGWLIVRIGVGVAQPESLYGPTPISQPTQIAPKTAANLNYDFSSDPFAFGEAVVVPLEELFDDAPETTLNLELIGIVSESSATFRLSDGKNKPVKLGEEVINGVTLTGTARDFVTLDVNGEIQKLTLERVKLGQKETTDKIVRAAPQPNGSQPNGETNLPTRQEAENLFSKLKLTPELEVLPDRTTKIKGFKINARSGADLSQFNLKSGDVITRVGPVLLNSRQTNFKQLRDLMSSGAAQDVEVIRNGAPVTIRIGQ